MEKSARWSPGAICSRGDDERPGHAKPAPGLIQDRRLCADRFFIRAQSAIRADGTPSAQARSPQSEVSACVSQGRGSAIARCAAKQVLPGDARQPCFLDGWFLSVQKTWLWIKARVVHRFHTRSSIAYGWPYIRTQLRIRADGTPSAQARSPQSEVSACVSQGRESCPLQLTRASCTTMRRSSPSTTPYSSTPSRVINTTAMNIAAVSRVTCTCSIR